MHASTSSKQVRASLLGCVVALATLFASTQAFAAPHDSPDWLRLLVAIDQAARGFGSEPAESPKRSTESAATADDPSPQNLGNAWFGAAPKVSVVARDWGSSMRLVGERLSPTEQLRLSQSTRMLVSRARLPLGAVQPFAQFGVGQWRVDRSVLPLHVATTQFAAQIGAGLEFRVNHWVNVAVEVGHTRLVPDDPTPPPQKHMHSALIAARAEF